MKMSSMIYRIRDKCPAFENRVGGSSKFSEKTMPKADVAVPYCFVVPLFETTGPADGGNDDIVRVTEWFGTIVCVDNSVQRTDGDAVSADDMIDTVRTQLVNALMSWSPRPNMSRPKFSRGTHLWMNNKRLFHQFNWSVEYDMAPDYAAVGEEEISQDIDVMFAEGTMTGREKTGDTYDGIEHDNWSEDPTEVELQEERDTRDQYDVANPSYPEPEEQDLDYGEQSDEFNHGTDSEEK